MIVFGGTIGAVMVQFPFSVVKRAAAQMKPIFLSESDPGTQIINDLGRWAAKARRSGLVSLDADLAAIQDPFLKKAMTLAVDGTRALELRQRMEFEMDSEADREDL